MTQDPPEPELRDYLRTLARRKGILIASLLAVLAASLAYSFMRTPVYRGTAQVLLQPRSTESLFDPATGERNDPARTVDTEIEVLKSEPVRAAVRKELGAAPKVLAQPVGETDVIRVRADSTQPRRAAAIANAYAKAYIDFRRRQAVDDVLAASAQVQAKVAELQRQLEELNRRVANAAPTDRERVERSVGDSRQTLVSQQSLFKQKLDQLQVDAALKTGGAQLVTPAAVPTSPISPTPVRTALMAVALGLMVGGGLVFLVDYLDDSLKTKEDIERITGTIPTLGLIPAVPGWKDRERPLVASLADPTSAAAEAYRSLRTSIQFMMLDHPMRTMQVTSPAAREGKSTTIANLAVTLAQAGHRVVVVCCDLRRPRLHEFFGLSNGVGFTSVLLGKAELDAALQEVPGCSGLRLMASGPIPPNPAELLAGRRTVDVLTALQTTAELVLIDCPPVLPVTDAAVLSSRVDATLLVATAGDTTRKELQRTLELLSQVDAPLIGTVLNGVGPEGGYGYRDTYRYGTAERRGAEVVRSGRTEPLTPSRAPRAPGP